MPISFINFILAALAAVLLIFPADVAAAPQRQELSAAAAWTLLSSARDFETTGIGAPVELELELPGRRMQAALKPMTILSADYAASIEAGAGAPAFFHAPLPEGGFLRLTLLQGEGESRRLKGLLYFAGTYYEVSSEASPLPRLLELKEIAPSEIAAIAGGCEAVHRSAAAGLAPEASHLQLPGGGTLLLGSQKVIDIATEADFEMFQGNGASAAAANQEILSILNSVDAIYQAQLGLRINVVYQHVWQTSQDPYSAPTIDGTLDQFKAHWENNIAPLHEFDIAHMFSGRSFGGALGIAFTPGACIDNEPGYGDLRYAVSRWRDFLDQLTVAHEIAHNFDSLHDAAGYPGEPNYGLSCTGNDIWLMCPFINGSDQFSAPSAAAVMTYASVADCIEDFNSPQPPVLVDPQPEEVLEGDLLTVQLQASDPNNDPLIYSAPNGLPDGAVLDPMSGIFSWRPDAQQSGNYSIALRASDPGGLFDDAVLEVSVLNNGSAGGNPAQHILGDFTGQGKAFASVYRPETGVWYWGNVTGMDLNSAQFGLPGDVPIIGDFDGDNRSDRAVFRPSNNSWYISNSATGAATVWSFGLAGDIPTSGDFNGDGRWDIAVFRPSVRLFIYRDSTDGTTDVVEGLFGSVGDVPVPCDYDGDGRHDRAVWSPDSGVWTIKRSSDGQFESHQWGLQGDFAAPLDFDGDGRCERAIWRPLSGTWWIDGFAPVQFGLGSDYPAPLDYDGDGADELAVWRPESGLWYVRRSEGAADVRQLGLYIDNVPVHEPLRYGERTRNAAAGVDRVGVYAKSSGKFYGIGAGSVQQTTLGAPVGSTVLRADYNGDGVKDIAVFSAGAWTIRLLNSGGQVTQAYNAYWGISGDLPVAADFDGDGIDDLAIFRPVGSGFSSEWWVLRSSTGLGAMYSWGLPGDRPMPSDINGDGWADPVVWRPTNAVWYMLDSRSGYPFIASQWGFPTDKPLTADLDRDGRADTIVWRPAEGNWYTKRSGGGFSAVGYGAPTDLPAAGNFSSATSLDFAVFRPANQTVYIRKEAGGQIVYDASPPLPASGLQLVTPPFAPLP